MAGIDSSVETLGSTLAKYKLGVKLMKYIPKAACEEIAASLSHCIDACVKDNDVAAWEKLFMFAYCVLHEPVKSAEFSRLETIKNSLRLFNEGTYSVRISRSSSHKESSEQSNLTVLEQLLRKNDYKKVYELIYHEKGDKDMSKETYEDLIKKHPEKNEEIMLQVPISFEPNVTTEEIKGALDSFGPESASGIDGLSAHHLSELVASGKSAKEKLLSSLSKLADFMICGKVDDSLIKYIYGANLIALKKRDGGLRPIAVGNTIRRLVAKVINKRVGENISSILQPVQVGYGCKGGTDAAIHATRQFLDENSGTTKALLKIDFANAFNAVYRDKVLKAVANIEPLSKYYSYLYQTLATPSNLFFGERVISSERGVQQGDPLGPMLFCAVMHSYYQTLESELCVWFSDDGTLVGDPDTVLSDFKKITSWEKDLGLSVNIKKCELCIFSASESEKLKVEEKFINVAKDLKLISKEDLIMLGSPLTPEALQKTLDKRIASVENDLNPIKKSVPIEHIEPFLKCNSDILKIVYILRTCPAFEIPDTLKKYDDRVKHCFKNLSIQTDDMAWCRKTLPINKGGLGIRQIQKLAPSAFLASLYSSREMVDAIYPKRKFEDFIDKPIRKWKKICNVDPPSLEKRTQQKDWDAPVITKQLEELDFMENSSQTIAGMDIAED